MSIHPSVPPDKIANKSSSIQAYIRCNHTIRGPNRMLVTPVVCTMQFFTPRAPISMPWTWLHIPTLFQKVAYIVKDSAFVNRGTQSRHRYCHWDVYQLGMLFRHVGKVLYTSPSPQSAEYLTASLCLCTSHGNRKTGKDTLCTNKGNTACMEFTNRPRWVFNSRINFLVGTLAVGVNLLFVFGELMYLEQWSLEYISHENTNLQKLSAVPGMCQKSRRIHPQTSWLEQ